MNNPGFEIPERHFSILYQKAYRAAGAGTFVIRMNGKNRFR
jgi:hypothetical protein